MPTTSRARDRDATPAVHHHDVVVIGAGFAGLGAAKRLRDAGVTDFVVLDRGTTVGGTWRDNTYPGAACDIPSHLYSFSFELNPDWSRGYPEQAEIHAYLRRVVDRHDLARHLRSKRRVVEARWEADRARWRVTCDDGEVFVATTVVSAVGFLRDGRVPQLPGVADFTGAVMHTSRWDHDVDLTGRRVAVVGTGASAIQVVPELAEVARSLVVFQRTPPYVMPRHDREKTAFERALMRHVPGLQRIVRTAIYLQKEARFGFFVGGVGDLVRGVVRRRALAHLHAAIADPDLRRRLTPDYPMGCKRILISDDYYPALTREHVTLATAVVGLTPTGVVDAEGREHEVDAVVFATGFDVDRPLGDLRVIGRDGADLAAQWGDKPSAHLGSTVPGFPNFFAVIGPNCGLGHNSMVFMAEAHLRHVVPGVVRTLDPAVRSVEVTQQAHDAFVAEMDRRSHRSVWEAGCTSWYLNQHGENALLWPGSTVEFWHRTRHFDESVHDIEPAGATAANTTPAAAV